MALAHACTSPNELPVPGVSRELAQARKNTVHDLEYDLTFKIPLVKSQSIEAIQMIRFKYDAASDLQLDFKENPEKIKQLTINGSNHPPGIINEHLVIPGQLLQSDNEIQIDFIAGDLSLNRNDEYLYTLLVPDRARTVFPVMDQPDLKAKWKITLDIPVEWEAVSNGRELSMQVQGQRKVISYARTKPISSYLFAFAAGKFQKISSSDQQMTMYYRESDSAKVLRNAPEIFDLHHKALQWLEEYTGIDYPFQKFDFALIPTFQYGGIEHPGAIFYRESALMLDASASINQKLRRASLISHETAHMWFGDLVTMQWFNDVWLKEVFANFMAAKMVNPSFPEIDHDLRFLLAHYPAAYAIDRSEGTHPIQQQLDNLQNAGSLYGAIIYQKAPIVMRNLEVLLGPENFRKGLQDYLQKYAYSNATWDQLIEILHGFTSQDLNQWNQDWIKKAGMPEITLSEENNSLIFAVSKGEDGQVWPQQIATRVNNSIQRIVIPVEHQLDINGYPYRVNCDGRGYAYFHLPLAQQTVFLASDADAEIERAAGWIMIWESFLHGKLTAGHFYSALLEACSHENNPLILDYLTGILQRTFWSFLPSGSRAGISHQTEEVLYHKMMQSDDISLKRIYFETYSALVTSEQGSYLLRDIWADKHEGLNLALSENDKIRLALEIALRDPDRGEAIIRQQFDSIKNPDNQKRLEFITPALSPDQEVRDHFFQSLLNKEKREQEPWVSEALGYLHHPLRVETALNYIRPSLEIIEEIKATGDIFFPKTWLDATLAGHHSKEAADIVRTFLKEHPELSSDLRNKILQSADFLFRAQQISN